MAASMAVAVLWVSIALRTLTVHRGSHVQSRCDIARAESMRELEARRPRHCCGNKPKSSLAHAAVCEIPPVTTCLSMATSMAVAVLWVSITLLTLTVHRGSRVQSH